MNINQYQPNAAISRAHLDHIIKIICGHEFNTPMATILGLAEMLQKDRTNFTSQELDEYVSFISASGVRLNNVSKRLGYWYTLYNHSFIKHIPFQVWFVEFQHIINQQIEISQSNHEKKAINISGNWETVSLIGDKFYLLQAITELINNAFKFSLMNTIVRIECSIQNDEFDFRVINQSDMISACQLKEYQVFDQFNRQKFEQQGLGIGLEIARLGIKQCGGSFDLSGDDNGDICEVTAKVSLPFYENKETV